MNRLTRIAAAGTALALGASGLAGCDFTDGFDEDPNAATQAPANLLLTAGQVGQIIVQESDLARVAGIFSAQFTGSDRQYSRIDRASLTSDDFSASWTAIYQETTAQLALAEAGFAEANNRIGVGVAKLHQAMAFGQATALFGDIPYTEALQPEIEDPAFDAQATVYAGVISTLESAIADLESGTGADFLDSDGTVPGDIFVPASRPRTGLGLTPDEYLEVAYTLLARYNLHIGNYAAAAAAAQNGISDPANNLVIPHGTAINSDTNIFYIFVEEQRGGYLTADGSYALQLLADDDDRTDNDARASFYYAFERGPDDVPVVTGAELNTTDGAFALDADFPLVTFAENQLILAEATLLSGGDSNTALDALNSVRQANQARFGVDTDDPETEEVDEDVLEFEDFEADDFASNNALLREILEEKYLSLIGQIEAYNDVRRTDNFIGIPGKNGGAVPQRFLYARNELNANTSAPNPIPPVGQETPVNASINYTGL